MTLEVEFNGKKYHVPQTGKSLQPGLEIDSGYNGRHNVSFFSNNDNQGGYFQITETFYKDKIKNKTIYSPVSVFNGEEITVETFDGDPIKVRGC